MKQRLKKTFGAIARLVKSPQGKSLGTFAVFLGISAILWLVLSLNEIAQRDLRCAVRLTNVPDSLTRVTPLPEAINVNVKVRAATLISYTWRGAPIINIDYHTYNSHGAVHVSSSALRNIVRGIIGQNCEIAAISPDTISVRFTNSPGVLMPVKVDSRIETAPQYALAASPRSTIDSVRVFSINGIPRSTRYIHTKPIVIENLSQDRTIKIPLIAPAGCRVIPDSVEVKIAVDPLVSKTVTVPIRTVGVPSTHRLIVMPAQIEVNYMLPLNVYKTHNDEPKFTVEVRYDEASDKSDKICVRLTKAPDYVTNAFIEKDSVMYLIEQIH